MCMKQATDVFNDWAHRGKDEGMERGHGPAVREMLDLALGRVLSERDSFSFADLGCGNGWVVRLASQHDNCTKADGFDGAEHMIVKAKTIDSPPKKKTLCDEFVQKGKGTVETYTQLRELFDEDRIRTMFNL